MLQIGLYQKERKKFNPSSWNCYIDLPIEVFFFYLFCDPSNEIIQSHALFFDNIYSLNCFFSLYSFFFVVGCFDLASMV